MKYATYLLDWDGCMAKTLQSWLDSYLEVYKSYGLEITPEEILSKSWGNLEEGPKALGIKEYNECWEKIVALVRKRVATVPLYDGVLETLVNLKKGGCKVAIVTSSEKSIILPALEYHGINLLIDTLVTEEEVSSPKPNPEIISLAFKKLNTTGDSAVIVGDTGKDIQAGQNAHIETILICHEENRRFYDFGKYISLGPTSVIHSFPELMYNE